MTERTTPVATNVELTPDAHWECLAFNSETAIWATRQSLLEIGRFEPDKSISRERSISALLRDLRATDYASFVLIDFRNSTGIAECRSRSGDRLYIRNRTDKVEIAAGLEFASSAIRSAPLSARFTALWLANAMSYGPMDLFMGLSPFDGVQLVARGVSVQFTLASNDVTVTTINQETYTPSDPQNLGDAIDCCKEIFRKTIANATIDSEVVAECSGGIDSSLAAVVARHLIPNTFVGSVFTDYPYREFRNEKQYAMSVANWGNFELHVSDPTLSYPWGASIQSRMHGVSMEPSLQMASWGQALNAHDVLLANRKKTIILTGHGGDYLFATRIPPRVETSLPRWISRQQSDEIAEASGRLESWLNQPNQHLGGYLMDNPWLSRGLSRQHQTAYYSPFVARKVIESFSSLRAMTSGDSRLDDQSVQKPLAYLVFADQLPEIVWKRRWKVNYLGLIYRFWLKHGGGFVQLVRRMKPDLENMGFISARVQSSVQQMAEGRNSADRLLNALISYLFWLDSLREGYE